MRQLLAKKVTAVIMIAVTYLGCTLFSIVKAGSGGPDIYGYEWFDSDEANGPVFSWIDLSTKPNAIQVQNLGDEGFSLPLELGWDFRYYWFDFSTIYAGANGYLSFERIMPISWCFPLMGNASDSRFNILAPYTTDLNLGGAGNPGQVWFWSNGADSAVISYIDVPNWRFAAPNWHGSNTFQVVLSDQDSSITFQYLQMTDSTVLLTSQCPRDLEIGIESPSGNIGLTVFRESVPADSFAVKFEYPFPVTFEIRDAQPRWNNNPLNGGTFLYTNTDYLLKGNIGSVGNFDLDSTIFIGGEVTNLQGVSTIWMDQDSIASLPQGQDSLIVFNSIFRHNQPGWYFFEVKTSAGQDVNPSNDELFSEIVLVENDSTDLNLSYVTGNPPGDFLFWPSNGGDDGGAIFIQPPGYPAIIREVEVFIAGDDDNINTPLKDGYEIQVWSADSSGQPDQLLANRLIPADSAMEDDWNRVSLPSTPTVSEGAFLVAVLFEGDQIGLGLETIGPKSLRNYEIIDGIWSPFRLNTIRDIQIKAILDADSLVSRSQAVEQEPLALYVSPNPASDQLRVHFSTLPETSGRLSFHDLNGRCHYSRSITSKEKKRLYDISLTEMQSGLYFLIWESQNGRSTTKVSIQR